MEYLGHLQFLHQNSMNSSHAHVKLLCQVAHRQSSVFLQGVVHWRNQTLIYFRFPALAFFFLQRCSAVFEPFEPLKHQRTANSWSSRCTFHQFVGLSGRFPDIPTEFDDSPNFRSLCWRHIALCPWLVQTLFTSVSNVEMTSKLRLTFAERQAATSQNFKLIVKQKMSFITCVFLDFTANLHLLREPVTMVIQMARAGNRWIFSLSNSDNRIARM